MATQHIVPTNYKRLKCKKYIYAISQNTTAVAGDRVIGFKYLP